MKYMSRRQSSGFQDSLISNEVQCCQMLVIISKWHDLCDTKGISEHLKDDIGRHYSPFPGIIPFPLTLLTTNILYGHWSGEHFTKNSHGSSPVILYRRHSKPFITISQFTHRILRHVEVYSTRHQEYIRYGREKGECLRFQQPSFTFDKRTKNRAQCQTCRGYDQGCDEATWRQRGRDAK